MKLLLIRHGQSQADILEVHEGRADFPLTNLGIEQAEKLASFVAAHFQIEAIIASPLQRAYQTAEILSDQCRCEVAIEGDLMEYNNGVLAGMSRQEALIKYPLPEGGRPLHIAIEGGESQLQFRSRVEQALYTILHDYGHLQCIALVAHGGTLLHLLNILLGKTIEEQWLFHTGDTGLHVIELRDGEKIVHYLNSQAHLA
ncbi:histidine phosphatase family protein [Metasolibacillus sp.]|uniref:histidine phosphatase family protein n=1 Tax=Metasolibacillus sp. TaxID=2703680 RepID=UPI0025DA7ABD|nr:histidine phosphatase family protein [Metasolibacillus sp.]MCT6924434.1 histidine phosphatase family protein [Metasolibacillus sp.]MCT6940637.1 histidine phosphatase family protein [Metasolibacillus sp.]